MMSLINSFQKKLLQFNNPQLCKEIDQLRSIKFLTIHSEIVSGNNVLMKCTLLLINTKGESLDFMLKLSKSFPEVAPSIRLICPQNCEVQYITYMTQVLYNPTEIEFWNQYNVSLSNLIYSLYKNIQILPPFVTIPQLTVEQKIKQIKVLPEDSVQYICQLGQGGYANVYKGLFNNQTVALKVLKNPDYFINSCKETEMIGEVRTQIIISNNPYICKFYGLTKIQKNIPVYIFEYIPNGSLSTIVHSNTIKLTNYQKRDYCLQCCYALSTLHQYGIIHGDLKCDNYLIDTNNICKLCDFGNISLDIIEAKKIEEANNIIISTNEEKKNSIIDSINPYSTPTTTHFIDDCKTVKMYLNKTANKDSVIGTIGWIAPEIMNSHHYSLQSDIYALGSLLYEILYQKYPYYQLGSIRDIQNNSEILKLIYQNKIKPSIPNNSTIPLEINELVKSCWLLPHCRPTIQEIITKLHKWNPYEH